MVSQAAQRCLMAEIDRDQKREALTSSSSKPAHKSALARVFPPWTWAVNGPLLAVAVASAGAAGIITALVVMHPYLQIDATVERDIQATNWGPLALTFPIFSWIGDAKGAVLEVLVFALVVVFNRRAWLLALAAAFTGVWYLTLSHIILRARPTTAQVLQVTEHPGASSFPSGHTIFVATLACVLMLCLGQRFLPRWARPVGWLVVVFIVLACAVSRIYSGAHWPSDVLAGIFIATAWLTFVVSVRWISDRALAPDQNRRRASPTY
jgi:membrane-associated phospholipid phosphatase